MERLKDVTKKQQQENKTTNIEWKELVIQSNLLGWGLAQITRCSFVFLLPVILLLHGSRLLGGAQGKKTGTQALRGLDGLSQLLLMDDWLSLRRE